MNGTIGGESDSLVPFGSTTTFVSVLRVSAAAHADHSNDIRTQPWSTYSVLQTTVTAWAFLYDVLIFAAWYQASATWSQPRQTQLLVFLFTWTFVFSKTVKLWGHFFRYPADIVFIPVYVSFGYFHGLIKLWGLLTLSEVCGVLGGVGPRGRRLSKVINDGACPWPACNVIADRLFAQTTWGSRDGADADNRVRMIRLPRYGSDHPDGRKSETFEYASHLSYMEEEQLPAYETHDHHGALPTEHSTITTTTTTNIALTTAPIQVLY